MLNRIITICIFSTLFFSSYVLFKEPFEFYLPYLFIVILLPFFILKFKFPLFILNIFGPLLVFGLINIWSNDNTYPFFFKIFINIFISVLFYYYVMEAYKFDLNKLFDYYMKGAVIVSVIGLIQFISFQIDFKYGYDFQWLGWNKWAVCRGGTFGIRLNSIFAEPSTVGGNIGTAFFVALYNLFSKSNYYISKKQSLLIIIFYLLTFSSVSYIGVFIALLLILINFGFVRYALIFAPIIIGSYFYLYNNVEDFRSRIDGINDLYGGEVTSSYKVNGSSFVQYNNFHVATENLKRNPLYGTGLGSHQVAYGKYSLVKAYGGINDFNATDANSMFYRLMSETGLFGLVFILLFIIKFFVLKQNDYSGKDVWLISSAVLVTILLQLLRQGNYTYNGFMFYMWMYYYAKRVANNKLDEVKNADKNTVPTYIESV